MPAAAAKKSSKKESPKKTPSHPTYAAMIVEAITELKERKGVSKATIMKFMNEKYDIEINSVNSNRLNRSLRSALEKKDIVHALNQKTTGATGRFRLPGGEKKKQEEDSSPTKPRAKKAGSVSPKKASKK